MHPDLYYRGEPDGSRTMMIPIAPGSFVNASLLPELGAFCRPMLASQSARPPECSLRVSTTGTRKS